MFFQNLSIGNSQDNQDNTDGNEPIITTPEPTNAIPEQTAVSPEFLITNNQRYFEKLVAPGSTNILITGSDPSGWNFDTIMIMSIDKVEKTIKLISLPRDIYIDYNDDIIAMMEEKKPGAIYDKGMKKINAVPSVGNYLAYKKNVGRFGKPYIDFLCDILNEVFDVYISDYAYVKVDGVRRIVDYFGGVTMNVPILMNYYDPTQNLDIYIEPGTQRLNGKNAEGFLRFRQGYDAKGKFHPYGDFYRKNNQSLFMQAFIKQHVTVANIGKLSKISDIITQNVITSVKGWNEIVAYGALAEEAVINDYVIENIAVVCTEKNIEGNDYVLIKQKDDK